MNFSRRGSEIKMQRAFHINSAERLLEVEAAKVKMDWNEEWGYESHETHQWRK